MAPVSLEPAALRSRVKHSTTEPLLHMVMLRRSVNITTLFHEYFCLVMLISVDELTKLKVKICLETHLDASNHM